MEYTTNGMIQPVWSIFLITTFLWHMKYEPCISGMSLASTHMHAVETPSASNSCLKWLNTSETSTVHLWIMYTMYCISWFTANKTASKYRPSRYTFCFYQSYCNISEGSKNSPCVHRKQAGIPVLNYLSSVWREVTVLATVATMTPTQTNLKNISF